MKVSIQAVKVRMAGIKRGGEGAAVWLRKFCEDKELTGHVRTRQGDKLTIDLYDTTVEGLDININKELIALGLASKKDS